MINTSAKWKAYSLDSGIFHPSGTLVGNTTLTLEESDFMMGTITVNDAISDPDMLTFGSVITNSVNFTLNNTTGKFDGFDFKGAVLTLSFTANFSDGTSETIQRGVYTLEKPRTMGYTIQLTGYDYMDKLNKYFLGYIGDTQITYPIAAKTLVQGMCSNCGVSYDFTDWDMANPNIDVFEYDESCTCRQVVSWVLQTLGGYARINHNGVMECKAFTIDDSSAYSLTKVKNNTVGLEDITVTGIRAFAYNTVDEFDFSTAGTGGYILSISENPMISSDNTSAVATRVWNVINGLHFHSFEASTYGDPSIEPGDTVTIEDYLGNEYTTFITSITYCIGDQRITCDCETPEENDLETVSPTTQTIKGATQAAYDYVKAKKISADYVSSGTLEGSVIAKNLTMEGGSLNIQTDSSETNIIDLIYDDESGYIDETRVRSGGVTVESGTPVEPGSSWVRNELRMWGSHVAGQDLSSVLLEVSRQTDDMATPYTVFSANSNGSVYIKDDPVDDFVIAHGTSGNWTWRKWHSGIMEEWYRETRSSVAITTRSGGGYYAVVTNGMSYPVAFLNGTYPVVQWSVQCDGGYGWIAPAYNYTNAYTGGAYIYSFSSVTKSFTYNIYAIGRWK